MASVAIFSVQAQGVGSRRGEAILFSAPAGDDTDATNLPSLSPKPPGALDLEDIAQVPGNFNYNQLDTAGLPPFRMPAISSGESARQRDLQRNWTLLTPAEILGAATPEKMMGITERDAFGQPKNLTALERYTARQNQMQLKTNALQAGDASSVWNFSGDSHDLSNSISGNWRNPAAMANPLFDSASDRRTLDRQNENSGWSRLFGQPAAMSAPNQAQPTDLERFRQLLNPGSSSITPVATSSSESLKTSLPRGMLDSSVAQASASRIGASFAPLSSGITKPPDLPKLPAAWSSGYTSAPPVETWSPQTAPWLSPGPQPLVAPQRKF